ncbi:hypothetical protein HYV86_03750 [Candidatus Woesearchaeota archaeon]|nr:hypothetical protein [Candidatus Woesearchaeota archaeon]
MVYAKFKQKCAICKTNQVLMYSMRQFPICSTCQMKRINQEIEDPVFKKFFDIPADFYEKSQFLRNIKEAYIRFGSLTENQRNAFLKAVEDMKKPKVEKPVKEEKPVEITIDTDISMRAKRLAAKAKKAAKKQAKEEE